MVDAVGRTLDPARGPETPAEAVDRLSRFYRRLPADDRDAFAAVLIGEVVALRAAGRAAERSRSRGAA